MKILIFIPARGGSKGIIGKNLHNVAGKKLIQYTIDIALALNNKSNDSIEWVPFLSSDDNKIIEYCAKNGLHTDYRRPDDLSGDGSSIIDAIYDALKWQEEREELPDLILVLQPTSPIRFLEEIETAVERFLKSNLSSLVSVSKMKEHPFECVKLDGSKWEYLDIPERNIKGRQDYNQNYYFIDGNFYIVTSSFLLKNMNLISKKETEFFELEREWPVDIDEESDLILAESLIKKLNL
tara:strand:+ start:22767 stop:23480 length:714 start_codon:yes stop_codon:yes gene_type:complete